MLTKLFSRSFTQCINSSFNFLTSKILSNQQPLTQINRKLTHDYTYRGVFSHERSPRGNQYKGNVMKRIKTHGLMTRLETRGGKQMLWRKLLKGPNGWIRLVPAP